MKRLLILAIVAGLAACGADGEPETPTRDATITLSSSGASIDGRVGVTQGPVTVTLGLGL